jgi:hypothetical protein
VLRTLGLELSPQKTKLVVFSPNNRDLYKTRKGQKEKDREDRWRINVREHVVYNSEGVKILGLPLRADLKWNQWVAETVRKTAGVNDILGWLRHALLLLRLYKSLVRARIEY